MYSSVSTKGSIFCVNELRNIRALRGGAVKRKTVASTVLLEILTAKHWAHRNQSQYCNTTQYRGKSRETEEQHAGRIEDREIERKEKKHEEKQSMAKKKIKMSERTLTEANLNATNNEQKK